MLLSQIQITKVYDTLSNEFDIYDVKNALILVSKKTQEVRVYQKRFASNEEFVSRVIIHTNMFSALRVLSNKDLLELKAICIDQMLIKEINYLLETIFIKRVKLSHVLEQVVSQKVRRSIMIHHKNESQISLDALFQDLKEREAFNAKICFDIIEKLHLSLSQARDIAIKYFVQVQA